MVEKPTSMLRSAEHLRGYTIQAADGPIGKVRDFYFDDVDWVVRYMVADTGNWLTGHQVLISPAALEHPDWTEKLFPVRLSREQIENSPPVSMDEPVSRRVEDQVVLYYGWPMYWAFDRPGMGVPGGTSKQSDRGDPHLRSVKEVAGYHIQATDDSIGHIEDFILDENSWTIRYIVVDTRNWLPGRKVLVLPAMIERVSWPDSKVHVALTRQQVKDSPEYDPTVPVNREFEARLYDYYGRPVYWP